MRPLFLYLQHHCFSRNLRSRAEHLPSPRLQSTRRTPNTSNNALPAFIGGMGLGATVGYLLDPERGRHRRARTRDKFAHVYHAGPRFVGAARRDFGNRALGALAQTRGMFSKGVVPDDVLVGRVRARLGRHVAHPRALEVRATDGLVTLQGPVRRAEVKPLRSAIARVRGVLDVQSDLEIHDQVDHIPALQGGTTRAGKRSEWLQENWSPAARVTAVLGGAGLGMSGIRMRGIRGLPLALAGGALCVRGLINLPFTRMFGIGDDPRTITMHKTVHVKGPIEDVFTLWTDFEQYSRFMEHVQEIRDLGDGRLRWRVAGPAGTSVAWDAEIVELIPNEVVAWQTTPDAIVRQTGHTRFSSEAENLTRMDVHLTYSPPAGLLGHLAATAFGVDPKHSMEDDLVRFQSLFEHGKTTAHGRLVTREDLQQRL